VSNLLVHVPLSCPPLWSFLSPPRISFDLGSSVSSEAEAPPAEGSLDLSSEFNPLPSRRLRFGGVAGLPVDIVLHCPCPFQYLFLTSARSGAIPLPDLLLLSSDRLKFVI